MRQISLPNALRNAIILLLLLDFCSLLPVRNGRSVFTPRFDVTLCTIYSEWLYQISSFDHFCTLRVLRKCRPIAPELASRAKTEVSSPPPSFDCYFAWPLCKIARAAQGARFSQKGRLCYILCPAQPALHIGLLSKNRNYRLNCTITFYIVLSPLIAISYPQYAMRSCCPRIGRKPKPESKN